MNFFNSFWKSSFYQEGKAISFWDAFWKVVLVIFLMSVVAAALFYVTFGKNIPSYLSTYSKEVLNGYPTGLEIRIKNGELSKNIPGELNLYPIKENTRDLLEEGSSFEHVVTINDKESISLALYQKAKSLIVLAKDGVVTQDDRGIKIVPYTNILAKGEDFSFTKNMIVTAVNGVNQYGDIIPWVIMALLVFFVSIFLPLGYLLATLISGLIVMWLSMWIVGKKTGFSESYILALYALAPMFIVNTALQGVPYIGNVVDVIPFSLAILTVIFLKYMFTLKKSRELSHKAAV